MSLWTSSEGVKSGWCIHSKTSNWHHKEPICSSAKMSWPPWCGALTQGSVVAWADLRQLSGELQSCSRPLPAWDWIRAVKQNTLNPDLAVFEGVTVHLLFRTQRLYFCLHLMSSKLAAKSNGDGPADRFLVKQLCWQCRLMFQDN